MRKIFLYVFCLLLLTSCVEKIFPPPETSNLILQSPAKEDKSEDLVKVLWINHTLAAFVAQKYNSPILLFAYSNENKQSLLMDEKTFSNPELATFINSNFVCTRVDVKQLNPNISPTSIVIFSPDGDIVSTIIGHTDPDDLIPLLKSSLHIVDLMKELKFGESSIEPI